MKNKVFNKIAQELYSNPYSLEELGRWLSVLINNKDLVFRQAELLQKESGIDLRIEKALSNDPLHIAQFYRRISNSLILLNHKEYLDYFNKSPRLLNLYRGLIDTSNMYFRPLQGLESYLEQERRKKVFLKNTDYKESPAFLEGIENQLMQNESDEAPIQRRPPTVSKLDQLIYRVNQEAENLSNKIKNEFASNLFEKSNKAKINDDSKRDEKLASFNNIGSNFKKAAQALSEYVTSSKKEVGKKTFPAKQSISGLVGFGIISSAELSTKLPNLKSGLDLLYSIN
jgi:hypothetical protein